jgi:flavin reductase (DIM6/NTAB) family NADH-FMN oxidoreductase RutF
VLYSVAYKSNLKEKNMRFDLDKISPAIAYKLLVATVVPRPIAWVVTRSIEGRLNAAPFSFFNVMGPNPATLVLGINADSERGYKDTARNIIATGEFVVNLVPFHLAEQMNKTAINAPQGINELELAGLTTAPSVHIKPPRIAESPVAFECVKHSTVETGPHQIIVIGLIQAIYIADEFIKDASRGHVDTDGLDLVGRTFGSGYVRLKDKFEMARPVWKP